jgi:hypothetical protein
LNHIVDSGRPDGSSEQGGICNPSQERLSVRQNELSILTGQSRET